MFEIFVTFALIVIFLKEHNVTIRKYRFDGIYLYYERTYYNRTYKEYSKELKEIRLLNFKKDEDEYRPY
jgi:hypothetical protein